MAGKSGLVKCLVWDLDNTLWQGTLLEDEEVRCYDAGRVLALPGLPGFSPAVVTVDARRRRQMYQAGFRRHAEREAFAGPDEDFLRSLELVMEIKRADSEDLSRVEELTLRTSQMNATGVHYPDGVLRGLLADPGHEVLTVTMSDRFGPHGAVGVMLGGDRDGIQCLHLTTGPRQAPTTMRLTTPDLTAGLASARPGTAR